MRERLRLLHAGGTFSYDSNNRITAISGRTLVVEQINDRFTARVDAHCGVYSSHNDAVLDALKEARNAAITSIHDAFNKP